MARIRQRTKIDTTRVGEGASLISGRYVFPFQPVPKGRPQFTVMGSKRFTRTPDRTRFYERLVRETTAIQHPIGSPYEGDLLVACIFYMPDRKHGDIDNLAKAILDAMQGVAFKNDRQIKSLNLTIKISKTEKSRTEVVIDRFDCEAVADADFDAILDPESPELIPFE